MARADSFRRASGNHCGAAVTPGALSAHSDVSAVLLAAIRAFAAGMLLAPGTTAGGIGVITLVTLVVFAAKPLPPLEALEAGAVAMGGGLMQTLLSTFLWPIRRYEPERRIIAGIYGELARIAKAPAAGFMGAILDHASSAIQFVGQRLMQGQPLPLAAGAMDRLTADLVAFQAYSAPEGNVFFRLC